MPPDHFITTPVDAASRHPQTKFENAELSPGADPSLLRTGRVKDMPLQGAMSRGAHNLSNSKRPVCATSVPQACNTETWTQQIYAGLCQAL